MLIACPDCATIQTMPSPPASGTIVCRRCDRVLERTAGRSLEATLALATATLLLLFPANLLPFFTVHLAGVSTTTRLASGCATMWMQGWWLMALYCGLSGMVLPFLRTGLLIAALGAIAMQLRGRWIGRVFRWAEELDSWAMADLLLFSGALGYGRVASSIPVRIDTGAWCLIGAAFLTMLTRTTIDRARIWRRIAPPPKQAGSDALCCTICDLIVPGWMEGARCPRCATRLYRRKPLALARAAALVAAGYLLLPIANFYPATTLWEFGIKHPHTIFDGVRLLFVSGYAPVAVMVFFSSIVFPVVKLAGLTWFFASINARSDRWLRAKSKLYRSIDTLGRWSFIDPFSVLIYVPLVQFGQVSHIQVGSAVSAFVAVVVTSMFASRLFDPRLMWDAAQRRQSQATRVRSSESTMETRTLVPSGK